MKKTNATDVAEQAAINEIARQAYLGDCASEAKSDAVKAIDSAIRQREGDFRSGVPFSFDQGDKTYTGKLILKLTRKWVVDDLVVSAK